MFLKIFLPIFRFMMPARLRDLILRLVIWWAFFASIFDFIFPRLPVNSVNTILFMLCIGLFWFGIPFMVVSYLAQLFKKH